jgi:hypothetical protein
MSFNTFCGQDPANAATYQKVLLRFQEGGGGGGIAAVNAGANIDIPNPAVPVVAVANPLNATLNFGLQSLTDSAGNIGAIGEVLGCGAAGGQTLWGLAGAAGNPVVNTTNANALLFPTLVTAGGGLPRQLFADDGLTPISVNAFTGDFNVVDTVIITQSQLSIGKTAGAVGQGLQAVAIGLTAGQTNQGGDGIAIGGQAGQTAQGISSVAIGQRAGQNNQSNSSVAIGADAGLQAQGNASVAVGIGSGQFGQGNDAVAVGNASGQNNQGASSTAVGVSAGETNQGAGAVAIGSGAGQGGQGVQAVAIGNDAATINQTANSICINATGVALQTATASLYVAPIINSGAIGNPVPLATNFLLYNPATAEVTYGDGAGIGGGGGVPAVNAIAWGFETGNLSSTGAIKSGPSAEFMSGTFSTTVGDLYDSSTGSPPLYADRVFCTCSVNCVMDESAFGPLLPYSTQQNTNGLNEPQPASATSTLTNGNNINSNAATQILWHLQFSRNGGAAQEFVTQTFASSPVLNFPYLSFAFLPLGNKFHSSICMTGLLDITGFAAADTITFILNAYTNVNGSQIDTTTASGLCTGAINMMCRPVRHV